MSNVDALSSLPAAPDTGKSALANNVKHQSLPGPSPPKVASPKPVQPRDPDVAPTSKVDSADDGDQPLSPKADSEAETIIQSGRESVSPEKRRKYIQHDPKRRDARNDKINNAEGELPPNGDRIRRKTSTGTLVRDRSHARDSARPSKSPERSPAQSPARNRPLKRASPSAMKKEKSEDSPLADHRETSLPRSDKPHISRKRSFSECGNGDMDEYHPRFNRLSASRGRTNGYLNGISLPRPASIDRSVSPVRPFHKRTVSGPQLGAGSDASKRRKAPTPLLTGFSRQGSEDRHSISSSTSGSPLPSAHVRKLTSLDGTSASPARVLGPKKQRDQNGRTRLARACAAQELDTAIARHAERPEDLNVADNAGNTPLQIAALEGSAPIVKFLIDVGCDLDTKNIDKDTPLIDAVENGHLDVVKILLEAGTNPRTVNAEGDEPYELVPNDSEDYEEIRRIIAEAKAAPRPGRRSEERKDTPLPRPTIPSPRESPPVQGPRSPILNAPFPRRRTGRSEVTRNDLLWTKATPENLQAFAAKGDMAGVATILNVGQKADPESMIAAAKGGHDEVLSLMLGIGFADPDPDPVHASGQKAGYNTPMLAAIGRGNLAVIRLLLDQPGFNPTRRLFRDYTYNELSRERKGENWEEESDLLKGAYDSHTGKKKSRKVDQSSPRRPRDREKDGNRHQRKDSRSPVVRARKVAGSPNRRDSAPKERKRDGVVHPREKSGAARPKAPRRDSSDNDSENRLDFSRPKPQAAYTRDEDSEATHRGDGQPKRRRLIAGRPPQDRRQNSLHSSDSMSGREENVKQSETAPAKRGPTLKRIRSSESPRSSLGTDAERPPPEAQKKKRRVLSEDGAPTNGSVKKSHDSSVDGPKTQSRPKRDGDSQDGPNEHGQPASHRPSVSSQKGVAVPKAADRSVVKEERDKLEAHELDDIPMEDSHDKGSKADEQEEAARREAKKNKAAEAERQFRASLAESARQAEEERAALLAREQQAEDERRRKEAEQRRQKQAEEERQKKLEQERVRVAKLRKEQEEKELRRREALPNRLRIAAELVGSNDPRARSHGWLKRFMPLVTAQTKQLDPQCETGMADEKWIPNYLVAPLLATNDLQLSQYVSWEKRTVTPTQRANLWRVTRRMLVPAEDTEASGSSMGQILQKDCATRPKYFDMEHVFWVKVRITR